MGHLAAAIRRRPRPMLTGFGDSMVSGLASAAFSNLFNQVEIRTTIADLRIDTSGAVEGPPNPLLMLLQPTVVLSGPAGDVTIAPWGEAPTTFGLRAAGAAALGLLAVIGIGWAGHGVAKIFAEEV